MKRLTHGPGLHGCMNKLRLAEHLGEDHNGRRHIESLTERRRWSKEELVNAHADMHMPRNVDQATEEP